MVCHKQYFYKHYDINHKQETKKPSDKKLKPWNFYHEPFSNRETTTVNQFQITKLLPQTNFNLWTSFNTNIFDLDTFIITSARDKINWRAIPRDVWDILKNFFLYKYPKMGWYHQAAHHLKVFIVYYQDNVLLLIRMMNDWRYM